MVPYGIGVLANIAQKTGEAETEIFDVNCSFWNDLISNNYSKKITSLNKMAGLGKNEIDLLSYKQESILDENHYNLFIENLRANCNILEQLYNVKIGLGIIEKNEYCSDIETVSRISLDSENNIYYDYMSKYIVENPKIMDADVILLSVMCKEQILPAMTLSNCIKARKNVRICIGGPYIEKMSRYSRNAEYGCDNVLIGKAECLLPYLIECLNSGKVLPKVVCDDMANNIVFEYGVDFRNLKLKDYFYPDVVIPVMTSRGCYYHSCRFCDNYGNYYGYKLNEMRAVEVFDLMRELNLKYACNKFEFIDDCVNPKKIYELANIIVDNDFKTNWTCSMRFSRIMLDSGYINILKRAGCQMIFMGLESFSKAEIRRMNKGIDLDCVKPILESMNENGIKSYISVMLGYPGQTKEDYLRTREFLMGNSAIIDLVDVNIYKDPMIASAENDKQLMNNYTLVDYKEEVYEWYYELLQWVQNNGKQVSTFKRSVILFRDA